MKHAFATFLACAVFISQASHHATADGVCSTSMAPVQVNKKQFNDGQVGYMFSWTFSPGKLTSTVPVGKVPCPEDIYGGQWVVGYSPTALQCMTKSVSATPTSNGCTYTASDSNGNEFVMAVTCGTTPKLAVTSDNIDVTSTDSTQTFKVAMTSSAVCPAGGGGGGGGSGKKPACTGGCAFLIIVFVGAAVYVAAVVLWNMLKEGKRGLEAAPHPEFWMMMPGLIKDGVMYSAFLVMTPCRNKGNSGGSYSEV